jgi:predicted transcriptional regulator
MRAWGFLTNHAHVLIQIARNPRSTVREIAVTTGITERAAHAVLRDLRESGIVVVTREGRNNAYKVNTRALADHPHWAASDMEIPGQLVQAAIEGLAHVAEQAPTARDLHSVRSA